MVKGKFITFEGCEGSGKSTQLKLMAAYLDAAGIPYIMTREPGGSPIAEDIRRIILDGKNTEMCDECEAMLYAASRIQHLKEKVIPALNAGKMVICDRYVDSSLGVITELSSYLQASNNALSPNTNSTLIITSQ